MRASPPRRIALAGGGTRERLAELAPQQREVALHPAIAADQHMVVVGEALGEQRGAQQLAEAPLHPVAHDRVADLLGNGDPEAQTAPAVRMSEQHDRGMEIRRRVLGDEHVDRAGERTTAFTADFQDLITRYAWGEIWARPGLDLRTRSCITLMALVALGREHELAMHVRAALRNGVTPDEIGEVFLQSAIYCGVPAANGAFAIAQEVLDELEREPPP